MTNQSSLISISLSQATVRQAYIALGAYIDHCDGLAQRAGLLGIVNSSDHWVKRRDAAQVAFRELGAVLFHDGTPR